MIKILYNSCKTNLGIICDRTTRRACVFVCLTEIVDKKQKSCIILCLFLNVALNAKLKLLPILLLINYMIQIKCIGLYL